MSREESTDGGSVEVPHPGGEPVKLRLTALQQDVLYHFIQQHQQEEVGELQPVLDDILDQLPEHAITSRPPSMEALIDTGYFDRQITSRSFDAPVITDGGDSSA